ncbi:hypothetical protein CPB84DRAFT_1803607 [Gymnopilus junonius]|uniref:VWFA domain-containing protein n=1 Tax=Gymnopilus junonius TaxID=109634 RepID=A0A9P5N8U1_GYMJU|nr:hypothetical protein CPB84DRAFT_1803607 [Gymnopilus junonius]
MVTAKLRRNVLPLARLTTFRLDQKAATLPDPSNVQGDIYLRLPKTYEAFICFTIANIPDFKTALKSYKPTTSADVDKLLTDIHESRKARGGKSNLDVPLTQIAFSRLGMNVLGVTGNVGDPRFDTHNMLDDKALLGDQGVWDPVFRDGELHGVVIVCAKEKDTYDKAVQATKDLFSKSIDVKGIVEGNVRPGSNRGKEHFGFQDGISEPALRGLVDPNPGQLQVDPGVIIMGYPGDPVPQRPSWAKDGSIMVLKKLEQDVGPFNDYIKKWGPYWRDFTPIPDQFPKPEDEAAFGEEYFAATIIGRWKSGCPLALSPFKDDPAYAVDKTDKTNDFDYSIPGVYGPSDLHCPFAAHARKTNPRNVDPYLSRSVAERAAIARAACPYGTDYSDSTKDEKRGLLFVCYQSSLDNGFVAQTNQFMTNDFFPPTGLIPQKHLQDGITGSPEVPAAPDTIVLDDKTVTSGKQVVLNAIDKSTSNTYTITGVIQKRDTSATAFTQEFFVTSRGGEYFFTPSVSTLQAWATSKNALDLVFLQDATGSQQPYIDEAKNSIQSVYDALIRAGKWTLSTIRFGIIAFRDHDDPEYVTNALPLTNDMGSVVQFLDKIKAQDGGDDNSTKIVVLITDSPPHGTGEDDDNSPKGCPSGYDPVSIVNTFARKAITLHVLACEPTLSEEAYTAHDFYTGMTQKTGGRLIPLKQASALSDVIIGLAQETDSSEKLVQQVAPEVAKQKGKSASQIAANLYPKLAAAGTKADAFTITNIYTDNKDGAKNAQTWFEAKALNDDTRSKMVEVKGFRISSEYRTQGGAQPDSKLSSDAVNLSQVETAVFKAMARSA